MRVCGEVAWPVDAGLRPEGGAGPLVRTLASHEAYYRRWASTWERQAYLRVRAVAGDPALGERLVDRIHAAVFAHPLTVEQEREVRRMKVRIERERIAPDEDPEFHLKLGRGGLSDIEWTVQLLQMRHGAAVPGLRTTRTVDALRSAVGDGLVDEADGTVLADAWHLVSRVRNAITLVRGKASDQLPHDARELGAVATVLALRDGVLPPTAGFNMADPECEVDPVPEARRLQVDAALSNSFAFGGLNAVLAFRRA